MWEAEVQILCVVTDEDNADHCRQANDLDPDLSSSWLQLARHWIGVKLEFEAGIKSKISCASSEVWGDLAQSV